MRELLLFALLISLVQVSPGFRPLPFRFVDEGAANPEISEVRRQLLDIARRQSLSELVALTSAEHRGEGNGTAAQLIQVHFTQRVGDQWSELTNALSLGGAFTSTRGAVVGRREFCAPYTYAAFPSQLPATVGVMQQPWIVVAPKPPVYSRPDTSSAVIATLQPSIIDFVDALAPGVLKPGDRGWVLVALTAAKLGYVPMPNMKSLQDWHVCLAQEARGWRVSEFARDRFVSGPPPS